MAEHPRSRSITYYNAHSSRNSHEHGYHNPKKKDAGNMLLACGVVAAVTLFALGIEQTLAHQAFANTPSIPPSSTPPSTGQTPIPASERSNVHYEQLDAHVPIASVQQVGYHWLGTPTISITAFVNELKAHHSPMEPYGGQIWDMLYRRGDNPAAFLADFWHESQYASDGGVAAPAENMMNMRTAWNKQEVLPHVGPDADFSKGGGWVDGATNGAEMVEYWSKAKGSDAVNGPVIRTITPASDGNNPDAFAQDMLQHMTQYSAES